jgi:hypothetical protein
MPSRTWHLPGGFPGSKLGAEMNARRGSGTRNLSEVRRVLIVDDNHDSAELLSLVLEREGHETRVAHHPAEAIPLAVQFRPPAPGGCRALGGAGRANRAARFAKVRRSAGAAAVV